MAGPQIDGCVQFYIAVPPQDMKRWPAPAIQDFFDGLAKIVYVAGKNAHVEVIRTNENHHEPDRQRQSVRTVQGMAR